MSTRTVLAVASTAAAIFSLAGVVAAGFVWHHFASDRTEGANTPSIVTTADNGSGTLNRAASSEDARVQRELSEIASEISSTLPVMVDAITRLDTVVAAPGRQLIYNYTIVGISPHEFDRATFEANMHPQINNNYATNPVMAELRNNRVTLLYNYRFENGAFAASVTADPSTY